MFNELTLLSAEYRSLRIHEIATSFELFLSYSYRSFERGIIPPSSLLSDFTMSLIYLRICGSTDQRIMMKEELVRFAVELKCFERHLTCYSLLRELSI